MTDWIDPQFSASLDAWRLSSRRAPRRHARERAYDAMLDAMVVASRRPRTRSFLGLRVRFGRAGLIASTATIVAATTVAAAGWNAAPGSALFVVREARQGVMLKLPGANDVTLHLQFAESSIAYAKEGINPSQSLADAGTELKAAFTALSSEPSSPLWPRYRLDEETLLNEESGLELREPFTTAGRHPTPDWGRHPPRGRESCRGERESLLVDRSRRPVTDRRQRERRARRWPLPEPWADPTARRLRSALAGAKPGELERDPRALVDRALRQAKEPPILDRCRGHDRVAPRIELDALGHDLGAILDSSASNRVDPKA